MTSFFKSKGFSNLHRLVPFHLILHIFDVEFQLGLLLRQVVVLWAQGIPLLQQCVDVLLQLLQFFVQCLQSGQWNIKSNRTIVTIKPKVQSYTSKHTHTTRLKECKVSAEAANTNPTALRGNVSDEQTDRQRLQTRMLQLTLTLSLATCCWSRNCLDCSPLLSLFSCNCGGENMHADD